MLLPPGQIIHKDLNTSFTNFEKMLLELRMNRFSGYIRANFWGYEGILILDAGKIIQGYSSERNNFLLGQDAVIHILKKASERDGTIDVHALSNETAITLASVLGATLYRGEEEVDGRGLDTIFDMLETEELTGYIDVQFKGKKGLATVFVLDGMPVESVIMSNSGRVVAGDVVYQKILEINRLINSLIKIYWNAKVEHIREDEAFLLPAASTPLLDFWNEFVAVILAEINQSLKKTDFMQLWRSSRAEVSKTYSCLDPINGFLQWEGTKFEVNGIVPASDFSEGMILSLALAMQGIPLRRRKKIRVGKIVEHYKSVDGKSEIESAVPDPLKIIVRIFKDIV